MSWTNLGTAFDFATGEEVEELLLDLNTDPSEELLDLNIEFDPSWLKSDLPIGRPAQFLLFAAATAPCTWCEK